MVVSKGCGVIAYKCVVHMPLVVQLRECWYGWRTDGYADEAVVNCLGGASRELQLGWRQQRLDILLDAGTHCE